MLSEEKRLSLHCLAQQPGIGEPGSCGTWQSQESLLQSTQLTLPPPLHTSMWAIARSPGSSAGKGGNLRPCLCSLPHGRKSSRHSRAALGWESPRVFQEWQQGARVESAKTDERWWAATLQRWTEAESQGHSGHYRHGPGFLSRTAEGKQHIFVSLAVFIFKQYWRMWGGFAGIWKSPFHKAELTFPYRYEKRKNTCSLATQ